MRLFNTLSRTVEPFIPLDPDGRKVGMYCCGPTVYDAAHIGNFRTFVFADLLRRYLQFKGFEVRHVMNITDVEDKIIARVRERGVPLGEYTRQHEMAFRADLRTLHCQDPHETPHATDFIPEMIALIERLVARGVAYPTGDGSVYFNIQNYRAHGHCYGQLVNLNFEEMRPGERVSTDEYEKESVADFALWKGRVPGDGDVFWKSPWGEGRPGWHIECSAMSMKLLGSSFDLHLGGEDLVFPHHEDEIAQSEGAGLQEPGQRFVKYWLHGAHLLVEGKKMSKKLGNYFTLGDLIDKGFAGHEIRYLLLTAHYRESFNFTLEGLSAARKAISRLQEHQQKLKELAANEQAAPDAALLERFTAAMDEDLNVSAAWGAIFEWVRENNRAMAAGQFRPDQAAAAWAAWEKINTVFGIEPSSTAVPDAAMEAPAEVQLLLEQRQAARQAKDFKTADAVRDALKEQGWGIEDTPKGARLKRLS